MRTEKIKISLEIPCHFDKPDCNGTVYTKEAIYEGVKDGKYKPINIIDNNGNSIPIGVVDNMDIKYDTDNNPYISVDGTLLYGGTEESVKFEDNKVCSMEILGVGLTK